MQEERQVRKIRVHCNKSTVLKRSKTLPQTKSRTVEVQRTVEGLNEAEILLRPVSTYMDRTGPDRNGSDWIKIYKLCMCFSVVFFNPGRSRLI